MLSKSLVGPTGKDFFHQLLDVLVLNVHNLCFSFHTSISQEKTQGQDSNQTMERPSWTF